MAGKSSQIEECHSNFHQTRRYWHMLAALAAACMAGGILAFPTATRAHCIEDEAAFAPVKPRHAINVMVDAAAAEPEAETLRAYFEDPNPEWRLSHRLKLEGRILGAASTYNPNKPGDRSGGRMTASGEPYEANGWAAAIQIQLRAAFNGVRYGRTYRPSFALVTSGEKSLVVKINDVGPLLPGRVIDLTERAMRYFDASLQIGVLPAIALTPLKGEHWRTGPVEGGLALSMAGNLLDEVVR
jgi:rare lipoprotein A